MLRLISDMMKPGRIAHLAVLVVLGYASAALAAEVRIGGTGNALGTMRLIAEAYMKVHPNAKVSVLESIGSSGAIRAVPKGAIEIGLSSRPLTDEEMKSGISASEYARTPTVFAVQQSSKATSVTLEQIADIYNGKLTQWPDGTPIRPVMRQPGDDNTKQVKQLSPEIEKALLVSEQRPGLSFATNDQEAANKMESVPGSFGVTALALIRSEKRALKPLALGPIEPTPENVQSGRYPIIKHFYFILPKDLSPETRDFLAFVQSPQGRKLLEQYGHTIP